MNLTTCCGKPVGGPLQYRLHGRLFSMHLASVQSTPCGSEREDSDRPGREAGIKCVQGDAKSDTHKHTFSKERVEGSS